MSETCDQPVQDAAPCNWVDRYAPVFTRPYLRLARADRPIGGWLLFWPCVWGVGLAVVATSNSNKSFVYILLFFIGSFAMRGAGCTWNDIVDRDIDALVERTRSRPLPSGQVRVKNACAFLVLQLLIGLAVLMCLPWYAVGVALVSLLPVISYPFMKRITFWPQAVLGICFAWGALMGWVVMRENVSSLAPFLLYAGAVAWVIGYDTVYALQDIEDDIMAGVGSTARLFGEKARTGIGIFYTISAVMIGLALWQVEAGFAAWFGYALFSAYLVAQVTRFDRSSPENCLMWFKSNHRAGCVLAVGIWADAVLGSGIA